jgi:shikimate dehydrogenase
MDGFIVTAPHKRAAVPLCDEVVGEGRLVGAINTVRRESDGRLVGDLFDGSGFVEGLRGVGWDPARRRIFLMGAGGAGNALAFALARAGVAALTLHNRTAAKAEDLAGRVKAAYPACDVRTGPRDARGHDIAVNATSVGLAPGDPPPFDVAMLPPSTLVAEVIMIPELTPLLAAARARGLQVQFGRHMLDCQVELMFRFLGRGHPRAERAAAGH